MEFLSPPLNRVCGGTLTGKPKNSKGNTIKNLMSFIPKRNISLIQLIIPLKSKTTKNAMTKVINTAEIR